MADAMEEQGGTREGRRSSWRVGKGLDVGWSKVYSVMTSPCEGGRVKASAVGGVLGPICKVPLSSPPPAGRCFHSSRHRWLECVSLQRSYLLSAESEGLWRLYLLPRTRASSPGWWQRKCQRRQGANSAPAQSSPAGMVSRSLLD